jgi:hypothetical protein
VRARAALARVVGLTGLCAGAACSGREAGDERALFELERMAFVPAAPDARLQGFSLPLSDISLPRALLVDLFEVTRADLAHWRARAASLAGATLVWPSEDRERSAERADWPAILSFHDAYALADARGMRLPDPREWLHVAVGGWRSYPFPWGADKQPSIANTLELGLGTPLAVGTFERGRSVPYGCYDLLGNAWEWVDGCAPGYADGPLRGEVTESGASQLASVLGGSFRTLRRTSYLRAPGAAGAVQTFNAQTLDPATLAPDIGARMVADAEDYLWRQASLLEVAPNAEARLTTLGRRWASVSGPEVVATLDALARRPGAPRSIRWLLEGARSTG